jgi:hypothetical protein
MMAIRLRGEFWAIRPESALHYGNGATAAPASGGSALKSTADATSKAAKFAMVQKENEAAPKQLQTGLVLGLCGNGERTDQM